MSTAPAPLPVQKFFTNNGEPAVGAKLFTYLAGTTTKTSTWKDQAGLSLNTNPIILDYRGECLLWLDPALVYKLVLAPATDTDPPTNPIWSVDNVAVPLTVATLTQAVIGFAFYPRTATEIAAGIVPVNYAYTSTPADIRRYGAVGDGVTNNATAIQNAITALGANGGDVFVPPGDFVIASTISLADKRSIRIYGVSQPTAGAAGASLLRLTQTGGSQIFDCRSTFGVAFENLYILQQGVGFAGHVIDYDWSASVTDSALGGVRNCYIQGVSTCLSLINLHKAITMNISGSHFVGAVCALLGGGSDYSNRINVVGNEFKQQVTAPIKDPGSIAQCWTVIGNTFEPLASGAAAAIFASGRITAVTFCGNWCGDASSSGSWIKVGAMDACTIFSNNFDTGQRGVECTALLDNSANAIFANSFTTMTTALHISAANSWVGEFVNNVFGGGVTALTGTPSGGRYQAGNNATLQHRSAVILSNAVANGVGATASGVLFQILAGAATDTPLQIKGAASQSSFLMTLRNSADAVLFGINSIGQILFTEQSDPAAPAANTAYFYCRDNGAGKTQIVARFPTGAIQVVATEP